ncbi:MAG TPA: hypothetical protein VF812_10070 [Ktedonobacterales bacterium]
MSDQNDTRQPDAASVKAALIGIVERGQADEETFRAAFSPEQRQRTGSAEAWAPKEVIAHLAYWKSLQAQRLAAVARGESLPEVGDFQTLNTESWPDLARLNWEESVARSDRATHDLLTTLEQAPESVWTGAALDAEQRERLIASTVGNTVGHVAEHTADYYLSLGDTAHALEARRNAANYVFSSLLGAGAESVARYNLACFYALHGQPEDAISELRQAFALKPELIPWAREDHDLDSLRENAAFQALVPPAPSAPEEDA